MPTTKTFVKVKLYVVSLWMHSLVAWTGLTSRSVPVLMWLVLCGQSHKTRSVLHRQGTAAGFTERMGPQSLVTVLIAGLLLHQ